jgi:hypothetical protein
MNTKQKQKGFHLIAVVLLVATTALAIAVGYIALNRLDEKTSGEIVWSFDGQKKEWLVKEGTAPACKEPLVFDYDPVDLTKAESIGMPGVYINYSYKVHGGIRLPADSEGTADIRLPLDGTLVGIKRYYEGSPAELQYLVSFENDCGIKVYFDHLYTLSPALQALAEQTPEPTVNDSRSNPADAPPRTKFKAGDVVATRVGFPQTDNYGFDFGVVDYRQENEITKNPKWASLHNEYKESEWYGVCWLDMLPGAAKAKTLIKLQTDTRRTQKFVSDYCKEAEYTTLDFNDGMPAAQY